MNGFLDGWRRKGAVEKEKRGLNLKSRGGTYSEVVNARFESGLGLFSPGNCVREQSANFVCMVVQV